MSRSKTARLTAGTSLVFALLFASGCATPLQSESLLRDLTRFPDPVELNAVPFFPQKDNDCGPAALAAVLAATGVSVTPQALVPKVYIPAREGTLQLELIAAARRYGRIPYVLEPKMETLLAEVGAGNPVVVLQNLGLSWLPRWHYAVVVGFNVAHNEIILRSGERARHVVPIPLFERTWRRADYWATVVMPPDRIPDTAKELRYLQTVAASERLRRWRDTASAYKAALRHWPRSLPAQLGLGNSYYALGDLENAAASFHRAIQNHPTAAPAYNNFAQTLADLQRYDEAQLAAQQAVTLGGPLQAEYERTLSRILQHVTETPRGRAD